MKAGTFKRWLFLLLSIFLLEIAAVAYFTKLTNDTWSTATECQAYLDTRPNNWTKANDTYFISNCDYENPISKASLAIEQREDINKVIRNMMNTIFATLGLLLLSIIFRWVLRGRS